MVLMDGRSLAKEIRENLAKEVIEKELKPNLAVILCGDDEASKVYVRIKSRACEEVGIEFEEYHLSSKTTQKELLDLIEELNNNVKVDGILLQFPLPNGLNYDEAAEKILPSKDVDGFNPYNVGRLTIGKPRFIPCTPLGIMKLFEKYNIDLTGKKVVIIGRSNIVGKPLVQCILSKNATVTICHSRTKDLKQELIDADVIIAAVGKRNIVTEDMVKEGAVVVDVGTNRDENGKLCGDVDFEGVSKKASYITPSPGGVGPMTVAMLMNNVVLAYKNRKGIDGSGSNY